MEKDEPLAARYGRAGVHLRRAPARRFDPETARVCETHRLERLIAGHRRDDELSVRARASASRYTGMITLRETDNVGISGYEDMRIEDPNAVIS